MIFLKSKYAISAELAFSEESDMEKLKDYISIRNQTKKVIIYSLVIALGLMSLLAISLISITQLFIIILGLLIIDIIVFAFNFVTYILYNSTIKQIKKDGNFKNVKINKSLWKVHAIIAALFLILGILDLINKKYFAMLFIILGASNIWSSLNYYKKYKKPL